MQDNARICKNCEHFLGGWVGNKCCKVRKNDKPWGFLCYEDSPACGSYQEKAQEPYDYFEETMRHSNG